MSIAPVTDPGALFTPRSLASRLREISGCQRAPVGPREIRRALDAGELPFLLRGSRRFVRWGDFQDWLERQMTPRAEAEPARDAIADRVAARVRARTGLPSSTTPNHDGLV